MNVILLGMVSLHPPARKATRLLWFHWRSNRRTFTNVASTLMTRGKKSKTIVKLSNAMESCLHLRFFLKSKTAWLTISSLKSFSTKDRSFHFDLFSLLTLFKEQRTWSDTHSICICDSRALVRTNGALDHVGTIPIFWESDFDRKGNADRFILYSPLQSPTRHWFQQRTMPYRPLLQAIGQPEWETQPWHLMVEVSR